MDVSSVSCMVYVLMSLASAASLPGSGRSSQCRCVPDQWQGILASLEREFDLTGGRTGSSENSLYVSYDFKNKRFAMTDLKTGNRAIADYVKGLKFIIREDGCRGLKTLERMRQMCLPEHAEYLGEFELGADIPVDLWQFTGPYNVSMKTTVIQKNCVPITEEVYMSKGNFASVQSSMYLDVTLGIRDESEYKIPKGCHIEEYGPVPPQPKIKRGNSEGAWSLLNMLRNDIIKN